MDTNKVQLLFEVRNQLLLFHWQTSSYARHKASDAFVKQFDVLIDRLVEAAQGFQGERVIVDQCISLKNLRLSESSRCRGFDVAAYLKDTHSFISGWKFPTEGLNTIRDELTALISKTQFLFSLQ